MVTNTLLKVLIVSCTISLLLIPMVHAEQYTQAPEIRAVPPPIMDRGSIVIPRDIFPEAKEATIPIYVPPVIEGSNAAIRDEWKTVKEIKGEQTKFEWARFLSNIKPGEAETPIGAGIQLGHALIRAASEAFEKRDYNISIQEGPQGQFRAIIQIGAGEKTTLRERAGETVAVSPAPDQAFASAVYSEYIAEKFRLPKGLYQASLSIDKAHKDDPYVAYVSFSPEKNTFDLTPKIYPNDEFNVNVDFRTKMLPWNWFRDWSSREIEISGEAFIKAFTASAQMIEAKNLLEFFQKEKVTVSNILQVKKEMTYFAAKHSASNLIKQSEHTKLATDVANVRASAVGLLRPETAKPPTTDQLSERTAQQQLTPVKVTFTQTFNGLYTQTPISPSSQTANFSGTITSGTRVGEGSRPGNYTGSFSGSLTAYPGDIPATHNNTPFNAWSVGTVEAKGFKEGTLKGTMNITGTLGGPTYTYPSGPVTIGTDGSLSHTFNGVLKENGDPWGTTTGTLNQSKTTP